jgi:endonuclease/exonuclease/phosphatase family metal-dependent hydrolase
VLAVVEAENRPALVNFNEEVVADAGGTPFEHVMLIDGNDERGIDVGILTRPAYVIGNMRSHVDDRDAANHRIFSRDCAEYEIATPAGHTVVVLVNHLKSKGFGTQADSNARRRIQAARVGEIFTALAASGRELVAVVGDFNDTPDSQPLAPLMAHTTLRDVFEHPAFDNGSFPGTFGSCTAKNKFDYILLSPALFARVQAGGVIRQGVWPGVRPKKWPVLETLTRPVEAASDHAAVWVDLDV